MPEVLARRGERDQGAVELPPEPQGDPPIALGPARAHEASRYLREHLEGSHDLNPSVGAGSDRYHDVGRALDGPSIRWVAAHALDRPCDTSGNRTIREDRTLTLREVQNDLRRQHPSLGRPTRRIKRGGSARAEAGKIESRLWDETGLWRLRHGSDSIEDTRHRVPKPRGECNRGPPHGRRGSVHVQAQRSRGATTSSGRPGAATATATGVRVAPAASGPGNGGRQKSRAQDCFSQGDLRPRVGTGLIPWESSENERVWGHQFTSGHI